MTNAECRIGDDGGRLAWYAPAVLYSSFVIRHSSFRGTINEPSDTTGGGQDVRCRPGGAGGVVRDRGSLVRDAARPVRVRQDDDPQPDRGPGEDHARRD